MPRPRLFTGCSIEECDLPHYAKTFCDNHYRTQYVRKVSKPLWQTWCAMKQRCYNPKDPRYKDWGGRGIKVCDRWLNDYKAFELYMGIRPEGCTLDRIDNDRNYEPGNVRWATPKQQAANRRARRAS